MPDADGGDSCTSRARARGEGTGGSVMNVLEEDKDDVVVLRVRAALRKIAEDDLRVPPVVPLEGGRHHRREPRLWLRPATIAAGLALLTGGATAVAITGSDDGATNGSDPTVVT